MPQTSPDKRHAEVKPASQSKQESAHLCGNPCVTMAIKKKILFLSVLITSFVRIDFPNAAAMTQIPHRPLTFIVWATFKQCLSLEVKMFHVGFMSVWWLVAKLSCIFLSFAAKQVSSLYYLLCQKHKLSTIITIWLFLLTVQHKWTQTQTPPFTLGVHRLDSTWGMLNLHFWNMAGNHLNQWS